MTIEIVGLTPIQLYYSMLYDTVSPTLPPSGDPGSPEGAIVTGMPFLQLGQGPQILIPPGILLGNSGCHWQDCLWIWGMSFGESCIPSSR